MPDRESIHVAHMRSIREVCSKDHGPDEIKGWGNRELGERWVDGIDKGLVWVVEDQGSVRGLAALDFADHGGLAHIRALYLTPEVLGMGLGCKLMNLMLNEAKRRGVERISLDSTITAHEFYRKFGFEDCGAARKHLIGGSHVTCVPMTRDMRTSRADEGHS